MTFALPRLYFVSILRQARRGCSRHVNPEAFDAEVLRALIASAFASGFVRIAPPTFEQHYRTTRLAEAGYAGTCKRCGCTDDDCRACVELTGAPCHWIDRELCSACGPLGLTPAGVRELALLERGSSST